MLPNDCQIERRSDGAIIVRVPSRDRDGRPLPDAVFAFRPGDCQYAKWERYLATRSGATDAAAVEIDNRSNIALSRQAV